LELSLGLTPCINVHPSIILAVYYWLLGLRPPHKILIGLFVDIEKPEQTVLEQSTHKITLKP